MASYDSEDAPMRFVTRAFKKLQCVSYDLQFFCFFEAIYEVFFTRFVFRRGPSRGSWKAFGEF